MEEEEKEEEKGEEEEEEAKEKKRNRTRTSLIGQRHVLTVSLCLLNSALCMCDNKTLFIKVQMNRHKDFQKVENGPSSEPLRPPKRSLQLVYDIASAEKCRGVRLCTGVYAKAFMHRRKTYRTTDGPTSGHALS